MVAHSLTSLSPPNGRAGARGKYLKTKHSLIRAIPKNSFASRRVLCATPSHNPPRQTVPVG